MNDIITSSYRRPSRGRSLALVAFLFGITGRVSLPGKVLRQLLEDAGLSQGAARAVLSRMRRHGQLTSQRRGRTTQYRLAGTFADSFERVRDQTMAKPVAWPGHFHALLYQVPEQHRPFRDELRRTAVLSGYGILQQGVLIATSDRSGPLSSLLATPPDGAQVWLSTLGMTDAEAARAASAAWDLGELANRYRSHIERLCRRLETHQSAPAVGARDTRRDAEPDAGLVRTHAELLAPALTDTLREPGLPELLQPENWPGPELRAVLDRFIETFGPATQSYVASMLD